jgi:hypothetical protein
MVHALTEIWRTLTPRGFLLDLRPFLPFGPLELVVEKASVSAEGADVMTFKFRPAK